VIVSDDSPKPLPFTQAPGVQADIRRALRELLEEAERGEVTGLFVAQVDKDDQVSMSMVGEKKYTLLGAATVALVHQAMRIATGKV
jgi:hypothetical protein